MPIESMMPSNHLILCRTFSSCLHAFPALGSFLRSRLFVSGGQSIGASASASVLPMYIECWVNFRIDWFDLLAPRDSQESSPAPQLKSISFLVLSLLYGPTLISVHDYWKNHSLARWTFVGKVMSLLLNMLSRLVITFLPRSKRLLISWLQSPYVVILEPPKIKSLTVSIVSPSICHEVMGPEAMIFVFWMLSFKPTFLLSSFTLIKRLFSSSLLSAIRVVSSTYLRLLIFLLEILIPVCASSSLAFHMMYSAYKLNKQGDGIQPWHIPFPVWNQSVVPGPVLTVVSWPAYRFLRRKVRWSGIPISFRIWWQLLEKN